MKNAVIADPSDAIYIIDSNFRLVLCNPAAERTFEFAFPEVNGKNCNSVFPFFRETGEDKWIRQCWEGQRVRSHNRPFWTHGGRKGYYDGVYVPIYSQRGKVIAVCAVIKEKSARQLRDHLAGVC